MKIVIKSIALLTITATAAFLLTSCGAVSDAVKEEAIEGLTGRNVDVEDGKVTPTSGKGGHSKPSAGKGKGAYKR